MLRPPRLLVVPAHAGMTQAGPARRPSLRLLGLGLGLLLGHLEPLAHEVRPLLLAHGRPQPLAPHPGLRTQPDEGESLASPLRVDERHLTLAGLHSGRHGGY